MLKKAVKKIFKKLGYVIQKDRKDEKIAYDISRAPDMEDGFKEAYKKCSEYTLTNIERMYALYKAVEHVVEHRIEGDIAECGVWKGGSMMLVAYALKEMGVADKKIYCYDTYTGMSEPTAKDISVLQGPAIDLWQRVKQKNFTKWCYSPLKEVKNNLFSTKYPKQNFVFVKGKVEDTIPDTAPERISLLRLDTDFYESTYHELLHLFPKLSVNGVVIIDDYGEWKGVKEAADRYFREKEVKILLNRIDYTGRIGVKV